MHGRVKMFNYATITSKEWLLMRCADFCISKTPQFFLNDSDCCCLLGQSSRKQSPYNYSWEGGKRERMCIPASGSSTVLPTGIFHTPQNANQAYLFLGYSFFFTISRFGYAFKKNNVAFQKSWQLWPLIHTPLAANASSSPSPSTSLNSTQWYE